MTTNIADPEWNDWLNQHSNFDTVMTWHGDLKPVYALAGNKPFIMHDNDQKSVALKLEYMERHCPQEPWRAEFSERRAFMSENGQAVCVIFARVV